METAPGGPTLTTAHCARGCTIRGQHTHGCTCTTECPDHDNHCHGCLPTPTHTGRLCQTCTTHTSTNLAGIPELTALAASREDGKLSPARTTDVNFARKGTAPILSPSPAWDLADETMNWAWKWAEAVADALGQWGPLRYTTAAIPAPRNLTETTTYLRNNLPWLLTHEPESFYAETADIYRTLERMTGTDRGTVRVKVRCPSCGQRTLTREDGTETIECRNADCRRIWRDGEFIAEAAS